MVGHVGDTDVKEGQGDLEEITVNDLQLVTVLRVLRTLLQFDDHSRVEFDGDDFLCDFEQLHGQVTSTGTNFHHYVCTANGGLLNDGLDDQRIFQDMLTKSMACNNQSYVFEISQIWRTAVTY